MKRVENHWTQIRLLMFNVFCIYIISFYSEKTNKKSKKLEWPDSL